MSHLIGFSDNSDRSQDEKEGNSAVSDWKKLVTCMNVLAGTQYRGDFENRIKQIMDGILSESTNNIVYIDEIHTLVGAGSTGEGAMDASNMLKPYLEGGTIRFIGPTTYEEYNRHFSRSKGLIRRFQQIDILEPSIDETKNIIRQLRPCYEEFHGVSYDDDAISFAVESSAKYINERFLPDKAIDLIDEAGAAMEIEGRHFLFFRFTLTIIHLHHIILMLVCG